MILHYQAWQVLVCPIKKLQTQSPGFRMLVLALKFRVKADAHRRVSAKTDVLSAIGENTTGSEDLHVNMFCRLKIRPWLSTLRL